MAPAGELDPPAPPAPTANLDEPRIPITSLPISIEESGSYYLTQTLTGVPGEHGITIFASNVTIDLNGFSLIGATNASGEPMSLDAVHQLVVLLGAAGIAPHGADTSQETNLAVVNGGIQGWGGFGVNFDTGHQSRVADLAVQACSAGGIRMANGALIEACRVTNCGGHGIETGSGSRIANCLSDGNVLDGVTTGERCVVTDSTARLNGDRGFFFQSDTMATRLTAADNGTEGIRIQANCILTDSTSSDNKVDGIRTSNRSTVRGCTVVGSRFHGINVFADNVITDNLCSNNGFGDVGAGIFVSQGRSRIERNHVLLQDYGIQVTGTRNLIIGNTASGNSSAEYHIGADNDVGEILDLTAVDGEFTPPNPWANVVF
jgi:parallel beta-helix repeat protein